MTDQAGQPASDVRALAMVIHDAAPDLTDPLTLAKAIRAAGYHTDDERSRIEDLIEQTSLGTFEAKAARDSVPREVGIAIVKAAEHMARADLAEQQVAAVAALLVKWDELSKGETATTRQVREVLDHPERALAAVRAQAIRDAADPAVFPGDVLTQAWLLEYADEIERNPA